MSCIYFQAEDGIRDYKVTGVQTCALPIWLVNGERILPEAVTDNEGWFELAVPVDASATVRVAHPGWMNERFPVAKDATDLRSEERRVGTEYRSHNTTHNTRQI